MGRYQGALKKPLVTGLRGDESHTTAESLTRLSRQVQQSHRTSRLVPTYVTKGYCRCLGIERAARQRSVESSQITAGRSSQIFCAWFHAHPSIHPVTIDSTASAVVTATPFAFCLLVRTPH